MKKINRKSASPYSLLLRDLAPKKYFGSLLIFQIPPSGEKGEGSELYKLRTFYLPSKPGKSVSDDNGKITRKEMYKLFLCDYLTTHSIVKSSRNVNYEKIGIEPSIGKNDTVWLLWGIFNDCIKISVFIAVLR